MTDKKMKGIPPMTQAQEGRFVDKDGKDHGDRHFHDVGWATTPEREAEDLEAIREYLRRIQK